MTSPAAFSRDSLRAVLFDAGETLIFMRPNALAVYAQACCEAGHAVEESTLAVCLAGVSEVLRRRSHELLDDHRTTDELEFDAYVEINRHVFERAGLTDADPVAFTRKMQEDFEQGRLTAPAEDTLPTLRRLRAAGLKIGIVSNASRGMHDLLTRGGFEEVVDHVAISTRVGWEKPSPRIFHACLGALGVEPHEAIHVGDSLWADGEGARNAGLAGFVLMANGHPAPLSHRGPVINSLRELLPLLGFADTPA